MSDAARDAAASSPRAAWGAVALAVAGGLLMAGGTTAVWVREETVREVGGVALPDVATVAGTAVAGELVGLGVAVALAGLGLLLARGRARRVLGVLLAVAGAAGIARVALGAAQAAALPGTVAAGPAVAAAGTAAVLAAAVLALRTRPARPSLPGRYTVDERDGEADGDADGAAAEWERASVEPDQA